MSHGRPDWYNIAPLIQIHASEDINELAARLGAPITVDRRGNVIAFDTFEHGIGSWAFSFNDGGSNANWVARQGLYGSLALRLHTVAGATKWSVANRRLPLPQSDSFAVEWGFSHSTTPTAIECFITAFTGTTQLAYRLKYTYATGVMAYYSPTGWVTLYTDTKVFTTSEESSNYLKLAVDADAVEFLRLITGDRTDSMVGVGGLSVANTDPRSVYTNFYVYAPAATAIDSYLQWLTLTINEL